MALQVLRSIAVYGASTALALALAHRFVRPLSRRAALALALAPLLFTGKALFTGGVYGPIDILYDGLPFGAHRLALRVSQDRTPLLGDVVYQQLPWRAAVRRAFAEGRLPLWNPSVLGGEPLLGVQQAAPFAPGTWIGMLLAFPQAWTFDMTLRLLIALLCGFLFFREVGCGEPAALLGALGWAFSNWMVFYLGVPVMPAAAPFPLLLLGLRRIARSPGRDGAAIMVVALVLSASAGHPETLFHASAAGGLYFLYALVRGERAHRARAVGTALIAAAVALGLTAVLFLPLKQVLANSGELWNRVHWYAHRIRSIAPAESLHRLVPQVMPYAVGVSGRGRLEPSFLEPSAYGGALLFPLAVTGLLSRWRSRWFFLAAGLGALAIWTKTAAADALARLPLFDIALNERLLLVTVFALCALAAFGADRLGRGEGILAFGLASAGTLALLAILCGRFRGHVTELEMPAAYFRSRFLLQVAPVAVGLVLIPVLRRRPAVLLTALVAIFAATRSLEEAGSYPTLDARAFYPRIPILERIPRGSAERMVAIGQEFIPNAAAVYGLEDVRGYEAISLYRLFDTFPLWTVAQPVWFNRVDDPQAPFLSFLNVRWVLTPLAAAAPPGWPVIAEDDGLRLLENPRVLPRAFVPRRIRAEPDPARRIALLASIQDFGDRGVVTEAGRGEAWIDNGRAEVRISRYGAQTLALTVDAAGEALVATSIPAWPGWKVRLDGQALPTVQYNHAFLAFRVPAGRHDVRLVYRPDAFVAGAAITAATVSLLLGLAVRARRARGRRPEPAA
jgi:hypothetical protein